MRFSLPQIILLLGACLLIAEASHFRFGTISYTIAPSASEYNVVSFTIISGWRRTFYDYDTVSQYLGATSKTSGTPRSNKGPNVGSIIYQNTYGGGYFLYYGDTDSNNNKLKDTFDGLVVTSINVVDDWIMTTWNITHKYPAATTDKTYYAYHEQSNRISTLKNNADIKWKFGSNVLIRAPPTPQGSWLPDNSPVAASLPIIPVRFGFDLIFQLPGYDPDSPLDSIVYTQATTSQMGGGVLCPNVTVSSDGIVKFAASDPKIVSGAYQTQIILTDKYGAYVPIDFIFNVTTQGGLCICNGVITTDCSSCSCGNCVLSDPVFIYNTTKRTTSLFTPGEEQYVSSVPPQVVITSSVGTPISIDVVADDPGFPSSYPVKIYNSGSPPGSTITTQSNCNTATCYCLPGKTCSSPQLVTLKWTPKVDDAGVYPICFGLYQPATNPPTYYRFGQTCFTLNIVPPICNTGVQIRNATCDANFVASQCCSCAKNVDPATRCLSCLPGYYGPTCEPCPDCGNGQCNDGKGGDGKCICDPGYSGLNCEVPNFSLCNPNSTSFALSKTDGTGIVKPSSYFVYMAVNQQSQGLATVPTSIVTPSVPSIDVVFLQDLGSLTTSSDLDYLSNRAGSLLSWFANNYATSSMTFASVSASTPYRAYGPLTSTSSDLTSQISRMKLLLDAQDTASTVNGAAAMAQINADSDGTIGWRLSTYRLVVFLTKRTDSQNIGYPAYKESFAKNYANVMYLGPDAVVSYFTNTTTTQRFGSVTALNQWSDWDTKFKAALPALLTQIAIGVHGDVNNMFQAIPTNTSALGRGYNKVVNFNFPAGVKKGTIFNLPTPTIVYFGWGKSAVTIVLNRAPTSSDSTWTIDQDQPLNLGKWPGADADNNLMKVYFVTVPKDGNITDSSNGKILKAKDFVYSYNFTGIFLNRYLWSGVTNFTYYLEDGCDSSAFYSGVITVNPVNYPPVAYDQKLTLAQESNIDVTFTTYVSDVDNAANTLDIYVSNTVPQGNLYSNGVLIGPGSKLTNQRLSFVPTTTFWGLTYLTFYARDPQGSSSSEATITFNVTFVNHPPRFAAAPPPMNIGAPTSFVVTLTDDDVPDSATVSYLNRLDPTEVASTLVTYSSSTANLGSAANPIFTNVQTSQQLAQFSFVVTTDDSASGQLGTLYLNATDRTGAKVSYPINLVAASNTPPFLTSLNNGTGTVTTFGDVPTVTLLGDGSVRITLTGGDNDGTQGRKLSFGVSTFPSNGDITTGGGTPVPKGPETTFSTTERSGSPNSVYSLVYTPNLYFSGADSVTIFYRDVQGGTVQQKINFQVAFKNHPPTLTGPGTASAPVGGNGTANYVVFDPDQGDVEVIQITAFALPNVVKTWVVYQGRYTLVNPTVGTNITITTRDDSFSFVFQANDYASGNLGSYTLTAFDKFGGRGDATVSVNARSNTDPFIVSYTQVANVVGETNITLSVTGSDVDGQQGGNLTFFIINLPRNGVVTRKTGGQVTANVAFPYSDNVPSLQASNSTSTYTYVYTPNALFSGNDTITFYMKDVLGGFTAAFTTTFNVSFVNHNPVVTAATTVVLPIGANFTIDIQVKDPDTIDKEYVRVTSNSLTHVTGAWVVDGNVITSVDISNGKTIISNLDYSDSFSLILQTDDTASGPLGSLTLTAYDKFGGSGSKTIGASAASDAPPVVITYDKTVTLAEDGSVTLTIVATDPDGRQGANLTFYISTPPARGAITAGKSGLAVSPNVAFAYSENTPGYNTSTYTYTFTPTKLTFGSDSIKFYVKDVLGTASVIYTTNFTVYFVNHPPDLNGPPTVTLPIGSSFTFTVNVKDPDTNDFEDITVQSTSLNSHVTRARVTYKTTTSDFSLTNGAAVVSNLNYQDSFNITLTTDDTPLGYLGSLTLLAKDKNGGSATYKVEAYAVTSSKPYITLFANPAALDGDTSVDVEVTATDSDGNQGTTLDFYINSLPSNGVITRVSSSTPVAAGEVFGQSENSPDNTAKTSKYTFRYTPKKYWSGDDSVSFYVTDALGVSSLVNSTVLRVKFVNHAPTLDGPAKVLCTTGQQCTMTLSIDDKDPGDLVKLSVTATSLSSAAFDTGAVIVIKSVSTNIDGKLTSTGDVKTNIDTGNTALIAYVTFPIKSTFTGDIGDVSLQVTDVGGLTSAVLTTHIKTGDNNPPYHLETTSTPSGNNVRADGTLTVFVNGTDIDSPSEAKGLHLFVTSLPVNGTLYNADGVTPVSIGASISPSSVNDYPSSNGSSLFGLVYKPDEYTHGGDSFSYYFEDTPGGKSPSYTENINVGFFNHPPRVSTRDSSYTCPLGDYCVIDIEVEDDDVPDSIDLELTNFQVTGAAGADSTFVLTTRVPFDGSLATFQTKLASKSKGNLRIRIRDNVQPGESLGSFTFRGTDQSGAKSNPKTINIQSGPNTAPVFIAQDPSNPVSLQGDSSVVVKVNATDDDGLQGQRLFLDILTFPSHGVLKNGSGSVIPSTTLFTYPLGENTPGLVGTKGVSTYSLRYFPDLYYSGSETFTYRFRDELGGVTKDQAVAFNVLFKNHPPAIQSASTSYQCAIGAVCKITTTVTDPDPGDLSSVLLSGFTLKYVEFLNATYAGVNTQALAEGQKFTTETGLASSVPTNGNVDIFIKIADNAVGDLGDFTVYAKDTGNNVSTPLTIGVKAGQNHPPEFLTSDPSDPVPVQGDSSVLVKLNATDIDGLQGQNLTLVIVTFPGKGSLQTSGGSDIPTGASYIFPLAENTPGLDGEKGTSAYTFKYSPNQYYSGSDKIEFQFKDELGGTTPLKSLNFDVQFKNHPPVVSSRDTSYQCAIGAVCKIELFVRDFDPADLSTLILQEYNLLQVDFLNATYKGNNVQVLAPGATFSSPQSLSSNIDASSNGAPVEILVKINDNAVGDLGTFKFIAHDSNTGVSNLLSVSVRAGADTPPTVIAQDPENQVPLEGDSSVTVKVNGTDIDGQQGANLDFQIISYPQYGVIKTGNEKFKVPKPLPSGGYAFDSTKERTSSNQDNGQGVSTFSFIYEPNLYFFGSDSFTYVMIDPLGTPSEPRTVQFDVQFKNHNPTLATLQTTVVCGIGRNCTLEFNIEDPDVADTESVVLENFSLRHVTAVYAVDVTTGKETLVSTGNGVVLESLNAVSTVRLILTFDSLIQGNLGSFDVKAVDNHGLPSNVLTMTINADNNNPPTLKDPSPTGGEIYFSLEEDGNITVTVVGTDQDGNQGKDLLFQVDTLPTNGKIFDQNGNQVVSRIDVNTKVGFEGATPGTSTSTYKFTYVPDALFHNVDTLKFNFVDQLGGVSQTYSAKLTVTHKNHPPSGSSFTASGSSGVRLDLNQFAGFDVDGDVLSLEILTLPSSGTLFDQNGVAVTLSKRASAIFASGQWGLYFVSDLYVNGFPLTSFQFRFVDSGDLVSPDYTATINIKTSNYPPIGYNQNITSNMNSIVVFSAKATDANDDVGVLTINLIHVPTGGALCTDLTFRVCYADGNIYRNASSELYYKPAQDQYSDDPNIPYDKIVYTVSDPAGAVSDSVSANLFVKFVNTPPVFASSTVINVFENDKASVRLSAVDDRTQAIDLTFSLLNAPNKGNLTFSTEDGTVFVGKNQNFPFSLKESRTLDFTPALYENGDNYTSFQVNITDTDGGYTIVTIYINVIPVNQPPEIVAGASKITARENQPVHFGFTGKDIDSPLESLTAIITRYPQRGKLHLCDNWSGPETDTCDIGEMINSGTGGDVLLLPRVAVATWRVVLVPNADEIAKSYATPSFVIRDDKLARSNPYILTIGILAVNKPPRVNATGNYQTTVNATVPIVNVTATDPDAGGLPINVIISSPGNSLNLKEQKAFQPVGRFGVPCKLLENGAVLSCTVGQTSLNRYLATLTFSSSVVGTHNVTVFVDDLGSGAEANERATSRLTASGWFTVQVDALPAAGTPTRNFTLAIGLASAGGALLAAAAVGAVARLIKKPDGTIFDNLLDFDQAIVSDNPLYEGNDGAHDNALYEDESAA
eukprot:TRINITY_DN585_c0_g1_i1.p1 TRINITY_DN585_c0_g1~~TRINITY_DN585_c0_g1_i1.p1  ORF type:complete len:3984 (+),score=976.45 TRINITY_DN585_c0_g1_i1:233-12184(+)